jgi:hypothetical protein
VITWIQSRRELQGDFLLPSNAQPITMRLGRGGILDTMKSGSYTDHYAVLWVISCTFAVLIIIFLWLVRYPARQLCIHLGMQTMGLEFDRSKILYKKPGKTRWPGPRKVLASLPYPWPPGRSARPLTRLHLGAKLTSRRPADSGADANAAAWGATVMKCGRVI